MLGTDRSSVTVASGVLQRRKIIRYTRGAVEIVNRKNLRRSRASATQSLNSTIANQPKTSHPAANESLSPFRSVKIESRVRYESRSVVRDKSGAIRECFGRK